MLFYNQQGINMIKHHLDTDLQQNKIVVQNQVTSGDKDQNFGKNEPKLGSGRPKQAVSLEVRTFVFQSSEFSLSRCPFRSCKLSLKAMQVY
jgi:hypothetical protein